MEREQEYFKIYNICGRQVLLEKNLEDEETWGLHIKFYIDNSKADLTLKYSTEELLNKALEILTEKEIEGIVNKVLAGYF